VNGRHRPGSAVTLAPVFTLSDPEAYLRRIGAPAPTSLQEVHRAHAVSVPFENLDAYGGHPISLQIADIEDKVVGRRQGGYCFEQNLLLAAALTSSGMRVEPMLARVRLGGSGEARPRTHLLLRVEAEGAAWHADVGFGVDGPIDPLPFGPGPPQEQPGGRYRIREDGRELVLDHERDGEWLALYGFVPEPAPMVDIETSNWFTSTHPRSPFVTGVVAGARSLDASVALYADREVRLVERAADGVTTSEPELADVPELLASRFGIAGTGIGPDGRLTRC